MKPQRRIEIDTRQLAQLLKRIENRKLEPQDYELLEGMLETWQYLCSALEKKNFSVKRLKRLLFGPKTEKSEKLLNDSEKKKNEVQNTENNRSPPKAAERGKPKGHGRNGAESYRAAERVQVPHQSLKVGDECTECGKGKLYELKTPSRVVVFKGQAPVQATIFECQRLRCSACGAVFVARAPEEAGAAKYDATAGSIVALLKYGNGLPFYRLEQLQKSLGIPLAASVQWKLAEQKAHVVEPVWEELHRVAAQGEVLNNDDTPVTILQLLKDRSAALPEHTDEEQQSIADVRTGVFTTAILSSGSERHTIALFHSGVRHAGENLDELLKGRDPNLQAPILMCDALSRNLPKNFQVILANCNAHARRQFVDLVEAFPAECEYILEVFKKVYHYDEQAKKMKLGAEKRLAYHRQHSEPLMEEFHQWLSSQFTEKNVEPNSSLGEAISYILKHWKALTLFLRVPGAPLDNSACERALKRAILNRKNSLFYKTLGGAKVGDVLMSVIYTCILCKADPFDYLTQIETHSAEVAENPQLWMPWNYREQIQSSEPTPRPT
jgi:transposase